MALHGLCEMPNWNVPGLKEPKHWDWPVAIQLALGSDVCGSVHLTVNCPLYSRYVRTSIKALKTYKRVDK